MLVTLLPIPLKVDTDSTLRPDMERNSRNRSRESQLSWPPSTVARPPTICVYLTESRGGGLRLQRWLVQALLQDGFHAPVAQAAVMEGPSGRCIHPAYPVPHCHSLNAEDTAKALLRVGLALGDAPDGLDWMRMSSTAGMRLFNPIHGPVATPVGVVCRWTC